MLIELHINYLQVLELTPSQSHLPGRYKNLRSSTDAITVLN